MRLDKVKPGEKLLAEKQNKLIAQTNRAAEPIGGGPITVCHDSTGVWFTFSRRTLVGLFELRHQISWPYERGRDTDPTPYCEDARQLWWYYDDRVEQEQYSYSLLSEQIRIWFPNCFRDAGGRGIGLPSIGFGDRVYCFYNSQAARWEALTPPLNIWRFELCDMLQKGRWANACLVKFTGYDYACFSNVKFIVYDTLEIFSGAIGDRGYAAYFGDSRRWEIIQMVC